jgi:hypothetical protein
VFYRRFPLNKNFGGDSVVIPSVITLGHFSRRDTSEKDILINAYAFYAQDVGEPFNLQYSWRLLKDEPKWMGVSPETSSKRTNISASGGHICNIIECLSISFDQRCIYTRVLNHIDSTKSKTI